MIISAGILKPPVGHLRGEQIFSERNFLSAPRRHSGRNCRRRNGAFAPEAWVRSASRPYLFFDLRIFASFAVRSNGRGLPLLQFPLCVPVPP